MDDCEECGGSLVVVGVLGRALHLRCRSCGADASVDEVMEYDEFSDADPGL